MDLNAAEAVLLPRPRVGRWIIVAAFVLVGVAAAWVGPVESLEAGPPEPAPSTVAPSATDLPGAPRVGTLAPTADVVPPVAPDLVAPRLSTSADPAGVVPSGPVEQDPGAVEGPGGPGGPAAAVAGSPRAVTQNIIVVVPVHDVPVTTSTTLSVTSTTPATIAPTGAVTGDTTAGTSGGVERASSGRGAVTGGSQTPLPRTGFDAVMVRAALLAIVLVDLGAICCLASRATQWRSARRGGRWNAASPPAGE